jgi:phosphopantothenate-cysteine ligase
LDRLTDLRDVWLAARDRLRLVPLHEGTVAEYSTQLERVFRSQPIDVAFLAMAVSDFEPVPVAGKLASRAEDLVLHCHPTPKVIHAVRDWAPGVFLVGFKLMSHVPEETLVREAEAACRANRADATVANDLETVRDGRHTVHLVRPGHPPERIGPDSPIAQQLVERVFDWIAERPARGV